MKKLYLFLMAMSLGLFAFSQTDILVENFESASGTTPPTGWTRTSNGVGWKFGANLSSKYWKIPSHTKYAAANDDAGGNGNDGSVDYLITPALDLSGYSAVILTFAEFMDGKYEETASVEVSTDSGSTWTKIYDIIKDKDWKSVTISLNAYAGQSNVMVGFHANDNEKWASGWAIDDVHIYEPLDNNVAFTAINTAPYVAAGNVSLKGTFQNMGGDTLTSINIMWSIDNGTTVHTDSLTGLSITTAEIYDFTHSIAVDMSVPQDYNVMMWLASPNGQTDGDTSNNQVTKLISSVSQIPKKVVVGEETGGTWCGFCPRGLVALKDLAHYHPDTWIGISVHNNDPMKNSVYDGAMKNYVSGYPSGLVDRAGGIEVDPGDFDSTYQVRKNVVSPVAVNVTNVSWDYSTREITFDVVATFYTNTTRDFRMNAVILEDSVTGTDTAWSQTNYYSSSAYGIDLIDWEGNNWKNYPIHVPTADMVYDHVARGILGGWNGTEGSIPDTIVDGTPNTYSYSYTVPESYDATKIYIVGMVIDQTSGEILNGYELRTLPTSIQTSTKETVSLFPNPTNGILNVANATGATIQVWSMLGQKVAEVNHANNLERIDLSNYSNGTFIVRIITDKQITTKKINLIK